jgi:amino-acid N-acetyltransferase
LLHTSGPKPRQESRKRLLRLGIGIQAHDIELAGPSDHPIVRAMLSDARLPVEDLNSGGQVTFLIARSQGQPVGAIGLERYGNAGLLRSLVVAPDHRLLGLGHELVRALEQHARTLGIAYLVLLTETAETFFTRLGYSAIARDQAPAAVTHSAEFRALCPATAVCMTKACLATCSNQVSG